MRMTCEDLLRSLLVWFFLEIYGDIGMYLSVFKKDKKFWIDRKNCLLRKKELREIGTPILWILQQLSCSSMLEHFAGNGWLNLRFHYISHDTYRCLLFVRSIYSRTGFLSSLRIFVVFYLRWMNISLRMILQKHARSKTFLLTSHRRVNVDLSSSMK